MPYVEDEQADRARAWAHAISTLLSKSVADQVLSIVLHEATWYVPLRDKQPRFTDLRYWSQGALDAAGARELKREHVTTRQEAKRLLQGVRDAAAIERVLGTMTVCVVTEEEHQRVGARPASTGWDRYRTAGVRVYDRKEARWLW